MSNEVKRSPWLTLVLTGLFLAVYFAFFQPEDPAERNAAQEGDTVATHEDAAAASSDGMAADVHSASATAGAGSGAVLEAAQRTPGQRLRERRTATLRSDLFEATVDNLGGGISSFRLIGDARFVDDEGAPMNLITTDQDSYQSLRVFVPVSAGQGIAEDAVWDIEQVSDREVTLSWEGPQMRVRRRLRVGEGPYQIDAEVEVTNLASTARSAHLEMATNHYVGREEESGGFFISRSFKISQAVCSYGEEVERQERESLEEGAQRYSGDVHVAAVGNIYFVQAMAAVDEAGARSCVIRGEPRGGTLENPLGTLFSSRLIYPTVELDPGASHRYRSVVFMGPKDEAHLEAAGHHLIDVVDLGFFSLLAEFLGDLLSMIQGIIGNWGLAIILLTFVVRLVLFPLTAKSFRSMARMRALKPEMERINELYGDDREKKGAATMELYRKHKINPLGGCLPQLCQLPIWWALYQSLLTNLELYHRPFAWFADLSAPDPTYSLPLALGLLMYLQQRLNPTTGMDPTQAKMMRYMMPGMITVFMLFLPAGLCLYMLTNSALGITQQKLIERNLTTNGVATGGEGEGSSESELADAEQETGEIVEYKTRRSTKKRERRRRGRA